jgi:hypothetical protein
MQLPASPHWSDWEQLKLQALLSQNCPAMHFVPHVPQFFGSLASTTHTPSQNVVPLRHWHWPLTHTWLLAQAWPHEPQLRLSLEKSAHPLPQRSVPVRHTTP